MCADEIWESPFTARKKVSNKIREEYQNHKLDHIFMGGNRLIRAPLLKGNANIPNKKPRKFPHGFESKICR